MTVTVSRLYDSYVDGQRAVTDLEAAGVPHSDISIVSNNSDNWYNAKKNTGKVDRDGDGVDDRAEGAGTGLASAPDSVALPGSSLVSVCWPSRD